MPKGDHLISTSVAAGTQRPLHLKGIQLSLNEKNPLITAATVVLLAAAIVAAVYGLGHYTLHRMLTQDALATADLWARTVLKDGRTNLPQTLAQLGDDELSRTLRVASIDGVVIVPENGAPTSLRGSASGAELSRVVADEVGQNAALHSAPSGAYSADSVDWFGDAPFRSWVSSPRRPDEGAACAPRRSDRNRVRACHSLRARGAVQRERGGDHFRRLHGRLQLSPAPARRRECRDPLPRLA